MAPPSGGKLQLQRLRLKQLTISIKNEISCSKKNKVIRLTVAVKYTFKTQLRYNSNTGNKQIKNPQQSQCDFAFHPF